VFENLTARLNAVIGKLSGRGKLSEADVDLALREVRMALLEADVALSVVKDLLARVRARAVGSEVATSLTPGQTIVRIVLEELTSVIGGAPSRLALSGRTPNIVMLVGLQGSGKTTATAKLAVHLRSQGRRPFMVACDVYRPAAVDQLVSLGKEIDVPVFVGEGTDPIAIARAGVKEAVAQMRDVVLIDTAGRLHVDEAMMDEAVAIKAAVKPDQILMVVDALTGQDAVNSARAFAERVDFDGVVITKLDGDARGGAALSVRAVTGKPVLFAGVGEKVTALEVFDPERIAKRVLGMGDVVSLIERAQEAVDVDDARALEERLRSSKFTLDDFLAQLMQVRKMGSMRDILAMLPGSGALKELRDVEIDEGALDRTAAIIRSMTAKERAKPALINGARRERIARGSGVQVFDVNQLLKQYAQAAKLMKRFASAGSGKRGRGRFMPPGSSPFA